MLAADASLPIPLPRGDRRLLVGLALSALAHLVLIAGVRPMVAAYAPARPLEVRIQSAAQSPDTLFATAGESDVSASASGGSIVSDRAEPGPGMIAAEPAPRPMGPVAVTGPDIMFKPDQYYTSREVDVRAEPLNEVPLVYPQLAYQRRIKGKVTLQIFINERGGIDQLSVVSAEPWGVFEEAALMATEALQFSAAMKGGRHVKSQKTVEVVFDPYESIHIP
jgi:TonB family protein